MKADSAEGSHERAVTIWEVNRERLTSMQRKLSDTPKLLRVAACSIFRVPQSLIGKNHKSYQPDIISIGPLHHGKPHLKMIEEHKRRYLGLLLERTEAKGLVLEDYLKAVQPLEAKARECYSGTIAFDTDEFIEMLVLDGCFIIELFRKVEGMVPFENFDPLITMSWIRLFLWKDLIRLENQIPFFVLQCLFDLTKMPSGKSGPTLATLALRFFNDNLQRKASILDRYASIEAKHLLDLLRSTFLPELQQPTQLNSRPPMHIIHSISKLRRAGIKLESCNANSFLVANFKGSVIRMPTIVIDDFMITFLQNAVVFEQCHDGCSKHFTTYVTLLDCLINTARDVGYLCDWNIIDNYLGSDADVASFFNNIGKDICFDVNSCYLAGLFADVDRRYRSWWTHHWASFRYTYFDTPWSFISAVAALVLLVLTMAQTVYTILGYVRP